MSSAVAKLVSSGFGLDYSRRVHLSVGAAVTLEAEGERRISLSVGQSVKVEVSAHA
jgi:hypothetical protein